jgi:hypothetical protein
MMVLEPRDAPLAGDTTMLDHGHGIGNCLPERRVGYLWLGSTEDEDSSKVSNSANDPLGAS